MIEKLDGIITRVVDRDRSRVYEALDSKSIIKAMNKINELVDKVNTLECEFTKEFCDKADFKEMVAKLKNEPMITISETKASVEFITEPRFGEWISISEKQPSKTGTYLFSFGGELVIAFYKAEIKEIEMPSGFTLSVYEAKGCPISIHWLPLPEPPKKEGAENV